mmetsp:Transcript_13655/g.37584  ORF Transcript_13655/g.37584 Transcript_13655/m.37584 type:complete len:166 (-) Transcript_13655:771-1268(-)
MCELMATTMGGSSSLSLHGMCSLVLTWCVRALRVALLQGWTGTSCHTYFSTDPPKWYRSQTSGPTEPSTVVQFVTAKKPPLHQHRYCAPADRIATLTKSNSTITQLHYCTTAQSTLTPPPPLQHHEPLRISTDPADTGWMQKTRGISRAGVRTTKTPASRCATST